MTYNCLYNLSRECGLIDRADSLFGKAHSPSYCFNKFCNTQEIERNTSYKWLSMHDVRFN